MGTDHERIWLQNAEDAKHQDQGRLWCENKVWPVDPEEGEPTEYVRADLFDAQRRPAMGDTMDFMLELKELIQAGRESGVSLGFMISALEEHLQILEEEEEENNEDEGNGS
jgi:hypothetical protein